MFKQGGGGRGGGVKDRGSGPNSSETTNMLGAFQQTRRNSPRLWSRRYIMIIILSRGLIQLARVN